MREVTLEADILNLEKISALIDQELEGFDASETDKIMLNIAVEEIYSNIAFYAYPKPPGTVKVCIGFNPEKQEMTIQFWDRGVPYDPLEKKDPDITLPAEKRAVGGLGIYMVKNSMDHVDYRYEAGCNVFTMKKHFGKEREADRLV